MTNASNETIQYVDVKTGKAVATVLPVEVVAAIGNIHESVRSDTENTSDLLDELSDRDAVLDVEFNKIDNNKEEINHVTNEPEHEDMEHEEHLIEIPPEFAELETYKIDNRYITRAFCFSDESVHYHDMTNGILIHKIPNIKQKEDT